MGGRLQSLHAEHLFVFTGLVLLVGAALADLLVILGDTGASNGGPHTGSSLHMTFLVNFVPMSIAFIVWGLASRDSSPFLQGKRGLALLLVLVASLADGAIHLFALNEHLAHPEQAAFFAVIAPVQILGALRLPRASPEFLKLWALFTAGMVAAYAVARATPVLGEIEPVETLGLLSKALELALLGGLSGLIRPAPHPRPTAAAAGP